MIKDLENAIGYRFQNITLLQNALTHSSYANERWHNSLLSNERLEFLGDSVLGMLVAEHLYRTFPDRPEGELTRMRADMVCEKALAVVANGIGLGDHLLLGHGEERLGGRKRDSILADAMESVIAACFLDGGMKAARGFIERFDHRPCGRGCRRCCRVSRHHGWVVFCLPTGDLEKTVQQIMQRHCR